MSTTTVKYCGNYYHGFSIIPRLNYRKPVPVGKRVWCHGSRVRYDIVTPAVPPVSHPRSRQFTCLAGVCESILVLSGVVGAYFIRRISGKVLGEEESKYGEVESRVYEELEDEDSEGSRSRLRELDGPGDPIARIGVDAARKERRGLCRL
ncbi:hypothetical protein C8R47DRAFT_1076976 [Mycena vitilis]|nr:hypothetical protein C8R47DRAFT_1076976 [Mycena vitilis]